MPNKNKSLVAESNKLIEASYRFNIWEDRIFLMVLSQIKPMDSEFKKYKIFIRDLVTEYGIKDNDVYNRVRDAATKLQNKKISIPYELDGEMTMLNTVLLISYTDVIKKGDKLSYIAVELHPELKPYLLQLKREFTQYNIFFMMKMQSSHSRRIYKLLKQYQKIGKRKIKLEKLREILSLKETEYVRYSNFKKRVILTAQKDLEKHTDIQFEFEEERIGRKVEYVIFYIKGETPVKIDVPIKQEEKSVPPEFQSALDIVSEWGITKATLIKCLGNRNLSHIEECISVVQDANNVKNKAAYFMKLVKEETVINSSKIATSALKAKKAATEANKAKEQRLKAQAANDKAQQYKAEQAIITALLQEPDFVEEVKAELLRASFSRYDESISFTENLNNRSVKASVHSIVMQLRPNAFN